MKRRQRPADMSIYELTLTQKAFACDDVVLLDFDQKEAVAIPYVPGQYINIFPADESASGHGKSYSMLPSDTGIRVAVRKIGSFSSALHELEPGARIIADGPHGTLCPNSAVPSFVCVAGGIGIAPFVSWYDEFVSRIASGTALKARFLISNTSPHRAPLIDHISPIDAKNGTISVSHFFTREALPGSLNRRISREDLSQALDELPDAHVAICGSIGFTRDMWKTLRTLSVSEERILTEAFY